MSHYHIGFDGKYLKVLVFVRNKKLIEMAFIRFIASTACYNFTVSRSFFLPRATYLALTTQTSVISQSHRVIIWKRIGSIDEIDVSLSLLYLSLSLCLCRAPKTFDVVIYRRHRVRLFWISRTLIITGFGEWDDDIIDGTSFIAYLLIFSCSETFHRNHPHHLISIIHSRCSDL